MCWHSDFGRLHRLDPIAARIALFRAWALASRTNFVAMCGGLRAVVACKATGLDGSVLDDDFVEVASP